MAVRQFSIRKNCLFFNLQDLHKMFAKDQNQEK